MVDAKIEVAWPKERAEEIAAEQRAEGTKVLVRPYDAETFCVVIFNEDGTARGLAAKHAGLVQ